MERLDFFHKTYGKYFSKLPNKETYLKRIGLCGESITHTKESLDKLQFAHLCTIPFENLDIFDYDIKVDFGVEEMFEKVVIQRRGGYCFELNAIYMALLEAVGFEVYPVGVRMLLGASGFVPGITHRASIVMIDGKRHYSDVGFGMYNAPVASINIDEYGEQHINGTIYTVEDRPYSNKIIMRQTDEGMAELFGFSLEPFNVIDFVTCNMVAQMLSLRSKRIAFLHTPDGSISIDGDVLRKRENGNIIETFLHEPEDSFRVLIEEFGMILTKPLLRKN